MKYRVLGKTGLKVSEIGCGTWQLANDPNCWVGADLKESLNTLHEFVELGGNFIDTAWIYGYSKTEPNKHPSEELIGKFLKESGRREEIIIATKIPPKNFQWPARKGIPISQIFPDGHIEKCVDDSLNSLGVDSIDLVQFHVWQDSFAKEEGWKKTMQKISREGKVKHWGISINDYEPSSCIQTLDTGLISTIQFIFNIFHQKPIEELFPYTRKNKIGLIARVPLDEGGLSGKVTENTVFQEGDFRKKYFANERLKELVKRTDALKKLLGNEAKSLPELALRYVLSFKEVSTAIPGMRKTEYVKQNTAISDGKILSPALLKELRKHVWERNFYSF
ncbi:MAG: aldo/keto reductase [Candidatus ainarchaeum sp.]|nr:aldo/keto reductase [Candidatus ainarchaeum sp.]